MASVETPHLHPPQEDEENQIPRLEATTSKFLTSPSTSKQPFKPNHNFRFGTILYSPSSDGISKETNQHCYLKDFPPLSIYNSASKSSQSTTPAISNLLKVSNSVTDVSKDQLMNKAQEDIAFKPISSFKGQPAVLFTSKDKQQLLNRLHYVLVGKFSHGRPSVFIIKSFFTKLKLQGCYNLSLLDSKHIVIECVSKLDFNMLWLNLNWNIHGFHMRMFKWEADFNPRKESPIAPVWVTFTGLPIYMFEEKALLSLSNAIGTPIKIDPANVKRVHLSAARVCVELDVSKEVIDSVWVNFEEGNSKQMLDGFWVKVWYGAVPPFCSFCSHIGHDREICKRRIDLDQAVEHSVDMGYRLEGLVNCRQQVEDLVLADVSSFKGTNCSKFRPQIGTAAPEVSVVKGIQEHIDLDSFIVDSAEVLEEQKANFRMETELKTAQGYNEIKNIHMAGVSSTKGRAQVKSMLANQTLCGSLGGNIVVVNVNDSVQNVWDEVQDSILQEGEQKKNAQDNTTVELSEQNLLQIPGAHHLKSAASLQQIPIELQQPSHFGQVEHVAIGEQVVREAAVAEASTAAAGDLFPGAPAAGGPVISECSAVAREPAVVEFVAAGETLAGPGDSAAPRVPDGTMALAAGKASTAAMVLPGGQASCPHEPARVLAETWTVLHHFSAGQQEDARAAGAAGADDHCSPDQQDVQLDSDHHVAGQRSQRSKATIDSLIPGDYEEQSELQKQVTEQTEMVRQIAGHELMAGHTTKEQTVMAEQAKDSAPAGSKNQVGADSWAETKNAGVLANAKAGSSWADLVEEEKQAQQGHEEALQELNKNSLATLEEEVLVEDITLEEGELVEPNVNATDRLDPGGPSKHQLEWSTIEGFAMEEIEMLMASPTRMDPVFTISVPNLNNEAILDLEGTPVLCSEVIRKSSRIADVRKHFQFLSNEKLVAAMVEEGKYEDSIMDAMKAYTKEIHRSFLEQEKSIYPKDSATEKVTSMTQEVIPKVSTMDEKEWTTPKRRGKNRNRPK